MWILLIATLVLLALVGMATQKRSARTKTAKQENSREPGELGGGNIAPPGTGAAKAESFGEKDAVTATKDGGWVINPGSPFRLTLHGIDQATAAQVKQILDEKGPMLSLAVKAQSLFPIILQSNLRCKEIEAYITEFRPVYLKTLDDLQRTSPALTTTTEKDREDLLSSFREQALAALDIRPRCNLVTLFEDALTDMTFDDALLDRFGYDTLQVYMPLAQTPGKIHMISQKHDDRPAFDRLVDLGLAVRGADIPLSVILETLKLKELKTLVADLHPPSLTRKAQAIAYVLALPDAKERISTMTSLGDYFQLRPFPGEFAHIDPHRVASAWQYTREIALLIAETYLKGNDAVEQKQLYKELDSEILGWKIIADEQACPYCKRAADRAYPLSQAPRVPLHIGCHCQISPQYASQAGLDYKGEAIEAA